MKLLRFLRYLEQENVSQASVFKAAVITQLAMKITIYRRKNTQIIPLSHQTIAIPYISEYVLCFFYQ